MKVLIFLCFCAAVTLAVEQQTIPTEKPIGQVIEIPIENQLVHKDVLGAHQAKRIAKWGGLKVVRSWPKYHQKLLESAFQNDYLFTNISLGTRERKITPNQNFTVMLSSGGLRAWVFNKSHTNGYDPSKSSTSRTWNRAFFEQDGSFNVTGRYYIDDMQFSSLKVRTLSFGVVDRISETHDAHFPLDGALGLNHLTQKAYDSGEELTAPIDNIMIGLVSKIVSIYMAKAVPPSQGTAKGQIILNGFDDKNCNLRAAPTRFQLYPSTLKDNRYVMRITASQYGSDKYTVPGEGYFDTSFSNIILPEQVLKAVYKKILPNFDWGTGLYTVPCDSISKLGYIYIFTRDSTFIVGPENYVIDFDLSDGKCALALELNNSLSPESYIFGTPAARSFCTVLDHSDNILSLYPHKV